MDNVIKLPGSDNWESGYKLSQILEVKFPGQQASDFAYMFTDTNVPDEVFDKELVELKCHQEGYNDGDDWIWQVVVADPDTKNRKNYFVTAWCDYTGWDCQSGSTWYGVI